MGIYKEIDACCDICGDIILITDEELLFSDFNIEESKENLLEKLHKLKWSLKDNNVICGKHTKEKGGKQL